jgi:hypothetical protein
LFLADPDEYDGGELLVEDTYAVHAVKLPAGYMVPVSGEQPAPRGAGHARRAHRIVLLDPEHDFVATAIAHCCSTWIPRFNH